MSESIIGWFWKVETLGTSVRGEVSIFGDTIGVVVLLLCTVFLNPPVLDLL